MTRTVVTIDVDFPFGRPQEPTPVVVPKPFDPFARFPKLRPCPLCGKSARWVSVAGDYGYTPPSLGIACTGGDCIHLGQRITERWEKGKGTFSTEPEVIKWLASRWNSVWRRSFKKAKS